MKKAGIINLIGIIVEVSGLVYAGIKLLKMEDKINAMITEQRYVKLQVTKNTAEEYRDALIYLYRKSGNTRRKILGVNEIGMDRVMQDIPVKDLIDKVNVYKNGF